MGVKKKPSYGKTCQVCDTPYTTEDEVYMHTPDEGKTWIVCKNEACFKGQGGVYEPNTNKDGKPRFTPTKFPIGDFPKLIALAEETLDSFLMKRYNQMTAIEDQSHNLMDVAKVIPSQLLTINEQAIFIESMVRSMVTGCKP